MITTEQYRLIKSEYRRIRFMYILIFLMGRRRNKYSKDHLWQVAEWKILMEKASKEEVPVKQYGRDKPFFPEDEEASSCGRPTCPPGSCNSTDIRVWQ